MSSDAPPDGRSVDLVAEVYSSDSLAYEKSWAPVLRPHGRRLLERLPLARAARVLDAGAGVGTLLVDIQQEAPAAAVIGVDCSFGMLVRAPRRFPRALMDVGRLGFTPGSFDVVVMAFVLFHLRSPLQALGEARVVLRSGGTLGTITWDGEPCFPAQKAFLEELDRAGAPADDPSFTNHDPVRSPARMRHLLESAGFERVRTWTRAFDHAYTREEFIALRTTRGRTRRRFEALEPRSRTTFLRSVHARIARMSPADLIDRAVLNYATATRS